jgi:hypothetical protein
MCQEKISHGAEWMDVNGKVEQGSPGNPTKNLDAYMVIKDSGTCELVRQKDNFLEVMLKGSKFAGRYVFREFEIKKPIRHFIDINKVKDDEVVTKTEKLWIMWKPKDQEPKSKLMDIGYKYENSCLMLWGSENEWRTDAD